MIARGSNTRQVLIDTTSELIDTTSIDNLTVAAVLAASDVSTGSFYHQFDNLSDLIDATLLHRLNTIVVADIAELTAMFSQATDQDAITQAIADYHRFMLSPARVTFRLERARLIGRAADNPRLRAAIGAEEDTITDTFARAITGWQERGWMTSDLTPRAAAVLIQSYTFGKVLDDIQPEPLPADDWVNALRVIIRALFP